MKHRYQIIKISDQHEFAGVGFAGNILIILNALTHIPEKDKLFVDMETYECCCTENNTLFDTNNCWEYYFDQTELTDGYNDLDFWLPKTFSYNDKYLNPNDYIDIKNRFYNSFKLKPHIQTFIDNYYEDNIKDEVTLGVQVRLTDMKESLNVSSSDKYISRVKEIILERPEITQIFLATDDNAVITQFKEELDLPILFHTDMYRADSPDQHLGAYERFTDDRPNHRYMLGFECLKEIFILTKCDYFLKADISALSMVGCVLSDNIKQIYTT